MDGLLKVASPEKAKAVPLPYPVNPEDSERQRRLDALARQRAAGTIATSSRGLLASVDWLPQRKSLLGE